MDTVTPPSGEETRAQLSAAEINDLPDSAFAYIEPGGKKDDEGKTTPRSLRHYPVHDEAHAENALARADAAIAGDNDDAKAIAEKALPAIKAAVKKFDDAKGPQKNAAARRRVTRGPDGRLLTPGAETVPVNTRRRKERQRAVPLYPEVRFFSPQHIEIRREQLADTDDIIIVGSPIVYDVGYRVVDMFGEFEERMRPGCATNLLGRGVDCRFLFNHDDMPMARTTSGTLILRDTPQALTFEAHLDARQQIANDLSIAIERGDLSQMSVGMIVARDVWDVSDGLERSDIFELGDLLDVSAVTYPCSTTTHIQVAQRMAFAMPIATRARLRNMDAELRAGKVLSADSQSKLVAALQSLHDLASSGGIDPADIGPNSDDDDSVLQTHADGTESSEADIENDAGITYPDGTGSRSDDAPAAETTADAVPRMKTSTLRLMVEAGRRR